jgi:prepilin-type N-terminal cleavage/methylation domain-containing protein
MSSADSATRRAARRGRGYGARGFSLLEALVALALIGIAGGALFSWLDSVLISASRVQAINTEATLTLDALPIAEQVNPMQTPEGTLEAPGLTVRWKSRRIGDERESILPGLPEGRFRIGLYDLDVEAVGSDNTKASFTIRRAGWRLKSAPSS